MEFIFFLPSFEARGWGVRSRTAWIQPQLRADAAGPSWELAHFYDVKELWSAHQHIGRPSGDRNTNSYVRADEGKLSGPDIAFAGRVMLGKVVFVEIICGSEGWTHAKGIAKRVCLCNERTWASEGICERKLQMAFACQPMTFQTII